MNKREMVEQALRNAITELKLWQVFNWEKDECPACSCPSSELKLGCGAFSWECQCGARFKVPVDDGDLPPEPKHIEALKQAAEAWEQLNMPKFRVIGYLDGRDASWTVTEFLKLAAERLERARTCRIT